MSTNFINCANQIFSPMPQSFREESALFSPEFYTSESNNFEMLFDTESFPQQENMMLTSNPSCMYGSCERLDWRRNGLGQENLAYQQFPCQSYESMNPIFDPFHVETFPQYPEYGELVNKT